MDCYEKNGRTAFKSNSGKDYFLPGSAAFEDIPHFKLVSRNGMNDCRCLYECAELNPSGERLVVELRFCENFDERSTLPKIWYKNRHKDHLMESWWHFATNVYDEHGCWEKYSPAEMTYVSEPDAEGNMNVRSVIDFEWMLEATVENAHKLFGETYRRFMACDKGKVVGDDYLKGQ